LVKNEADQPGATRSRDVIQAGAPRLGREAEAQDVSTGALAGIAGGMAVIACVGIVLLKFVAWRLKERDNCEGV
jgi:hypothetical protein